VNAFETVLVIMAVFFGIGMAVGSLLIMALPQIRSAWLARFAAAQPLQPDGDGELDTGPPATWAAPGELEPDDREDFPWRGDVS
jgi:hypothetical protein